MDHHILLSKLHLCGITGVSPKWFSSYLDNRNAKRLVNGSLSECILLNDLGWQNLETQGQIQKAVMVYKSLNCLAPDYMFSKFILRSDLLNSYNLRDSENKLTVPLPRTNY